MIRNEANYSYIKITQYFCGTCFSKRMTPKEAWNEMKTNAKIDVLLAGYGGGPAPTCLVENPFIHLIKNGDFCLKSACSPAGDFNAGKI